MNVLVFADNNQGKVAKSAFEASSYGAKIAAENGGTASIVTYGKLDDSEMEELASYGISNITVGTGITDMDPQRLSRLCQAVSETNNAELIIFSHDYSGKSIAPIVSGRMKAGLVSGAIEYPVLADGFTIRKAVFSGKAFANVKITSPTKVISLLPNSVGKTKTPASANITEVTDSFGSPSVQVKDFVVEGGDGINLTEAELVVSAGRGLKDPSNWGMIEELASELGAATACSRPVADIGWRPHHEHVGQTGIAIRPNLYIAAGISGAIQHLAGVNGSKVIVVINTDPEAPFFKAADYGIVGDAFVVIPKLIEAVRQLKLSEA
ncbi:MAG TPA: electron transfer flavoprotein subunit alpha [Flavobacteriales bacterium]|jgi:electron transfer flavoprotein alpha subunit|nr:electron transfer flavoprotein subunit alpha/FixB family protein [Flavobacteriales bacterium]HAW20218.1 electron transfer flavoprotein subunit alpha [Flavobacteriales bacterium]